MFSFNYIKAKLIFFNVHYYGFFFLIHFFILTSILVFCFCENWKRPHPSVFKDGHSNCALQNTDSKWQEKDKEKSEKREEMVLVKPWEQEREREREREKRREKKG